MSNVYGELGKPVSDLRQTSRRVVRELGLIREGFGDPSLPLSHCHALMEIENQGNLTLMELSSLLTLDKSTTSRILGQLSERKWISFEEEREDRRRKLVKLTTAGRRALKQIHQKAGGTVFRALQLLEEEERQTVQRGMTLYAQALRKARLRSDFAIRKIQRKDNSAIAGIIRLVMTEHEATGPGHSINDPEVDAMFQTYNQPRWTYFVVTRGDRVAGGGGIAPLAGAEEDTCELRKMYFLPEARGLGMGQEMLDRCLKTAKALGYRRCYLETLARMSVARELYKRNGFKVLTKPRGRTGHFTCDSFLIRDL